MLGRYKLGRAFGIDVFVHWTFVFAPIIVVLQTRHLGWQTVCMALILLLCFFASVLLHEFGHSLVGKCFSVQTHDIVITPIGGLARLHGLSRKMPFEEMIITLAGPAVNLVLAALFFGFLWATGQPFAIPDGADGLLEFSRILFWANLMLCTINMIPAFPMDGGRIFRAFLAMFINYTNATRIASWLGRILSLTCVGIGIWNWELPLVIVGVFVFVAGESEIGMIHSYDKDQANRKSLNEF